MSSQPQRTEQEKSPMKISDFLSGKPQIEPVQQSTLFSRLRTFLPEMEQANQNMNLDATNDAFQIIENVAESSSSSSSDDSDLDSDSEDVGDSEEPQNSDCQKQRIEIDLDVFREQNSVVDGRDVSVQSVDSLPTAFQSKSDEDDGKKKKPLIEEL